RAAWLAAGVAALSIGAGAGWGAERAATSERSLDDTTGTVSITVPEAWTAQVDPEQWVPTQGQQEQPSLAAGTRAGWNTEADAAPGVFVGILAGDKLPSRVPQHAECRGDTVGPILDEREGDQSMTVFFTGCPGAEVTVERVVQVNSSQLLWVQIRSADRATANRVLESVTTYGI
ncbi:hypothetical protein, partial [Nocardioides sp.]|uniref:hypothetical protein n=1 Tax=Nocardioides sp. TaxID=35761 RepID=UPI00262E2E82